MGGYPCFKETVKQLQTNKICYGEMDPVLRDVMNDIGPKNFLVRCVSTWSGLDSDHMFDNARTYRLCASFAVAISIVFECSDGQWGMLLNGNFISYDSAASVIIFHGDHVRFMGFCYGSDLNHYVSDMMGPKGELPRFGVWEVLCGS